MSVLYEEADGVSAWPVNKTINVNDCMKFSKKLNVNNEQIAKLLKAKEHTKTWIKNVEKIHKTRNSIIDQPVVNYDLVYDSKNKNLGINCSSTPSMYPSVLPIVYSCSFCRSMVKTGVSQYHGTLAFPYVLLCTACSNKKG
jgi:hypothetical protein